MFLVEYDKSVLAEKLDSREQGAKSMKCRNRAGKVNVRFHRRVTFVAVLMLGACAPVVLMARNDSYINNFSTRTSVGAIPTAEWRTVKYATGLLANPGTYSGDIWMYGNWKCDALGGQRLCSRRRRKQLGYCLLHRRKGLIPSAWYFQASARQYLYDRCRHRAVRFPASDQLEGL